MKRKTNQTADQTTTSEKTVSPQESAASPSGFGDWEVIHCYSRAQALADGVLIDVSQLAREAGFRYPLAMTAAAWCDSVAVSHTDHVHDETGRLWDVLHVLRFAIKSNLDGTDVHFCVDVADEHEQITRVRLKCVCGPGDELEPVLTVMLPQED